MKLRVLTYNMHKGFCFYSRQYVLRELREAIRSVDADVVFLQEVMGVHPARVAVTNLGPQFEFLADELWPHFAYGKNAVYSDGHHGNAILSKFPLLAFENINVSTNPLERRGLLHAKIQPQDGNQVDLLCLHLDLTQRGRVQQLEHLVDRVTQHVSRGSPLVIAGDFNDWRQKMTDPLADRLNLIEAGVIWNGQHAPTFPSWRPFLGLDRIYLRNFKVHDFAVLSGAMWRKLSDHAAVVAEVEIIS
jgi:endonuclease/exonuclease/phosphatase family metal-dependent hydrolase